MKRVEGAQVVVSPEIGLRIGGRAIVKRGRANIARRGERVGVEASQVTILFEKKMPALPLLPPTDQQCTKPCVVQGSKGFSLAQRAKGETIVVEN